MSSSSSDSDSDDYEPIRRIKINIRPKEEVQRTGAADISEIKASVEAWRPLEAPPHPSLSRRQPSLSSVSSISFGAGSSFGGSNNNSSANFGTHYANNASNKHPFGDAFGGSIHSSPSCSSLVNEFNTRPSYSKNIITTLSRTSSPLTLANHHSDSVPIAVAIQESVELIVRGVYDPTALEPKYDARCLGNIKVAFPNAFAAKCFNNMPIAPLKLLMHSTENITRHYASRLVKDLDLGTNTVTRQTVINESLCKDNQNQDNTSKANLMRSLVNGNHTQPRDLLTDFSEMPSMTQKVSEPKAASSKTIEFDMVALSNQLRDMYKQSPGSRYYNVDILRYQVTNIKSIEESPLQVCAYWKVEPNLVKLRIDFKHSNKSGLNLERLRDVTFTVSFTEFIPTGIDVNSLSPNSLTNLRLNNNNNDSGSLNMNNLESNLADQTLTNNQGFSLLDQPEGMHGERWGNSTSSSGSSTLSYSSQSKTPTSKPMSALASNESTRGGNLSDSSQLTNFDAFSVPNNDHFKSTYSLLTGATATSQRVSPSSSIFGQEKSNREAESSPSLPPYVTHKPAAHWNSSIKQLTWKFDNLLTYYKGEGFGSLFAKLDFRHQNGAPAMQMLRDCKPPPVDAKFLVVDSTLSKTSISIDSAGYRLSMLKKEVRSGRYKSEPYIL